MSYTQRRQETLRKLDIEELPTLRMSSAEEDLHLLVGGDLPVRTMPVSTRSLRLLPIDIDTPPGSRTKVPKLRFERPDSLGYPGQALPAMRYSSQLKLNDIYGGRYEFEGVRQRDVRIFIQKIVHSSTSERLSDSKHSMYFFKTHCVYWRVG